MPVSDIEARDAARELASQGGHLLRHLLGRHVRGARRRSPTKAPKGSVILAMLPDTGERYLSTILFEGINEGTDEVPGL